MESYASEGMKRFNHLLGELDGVYHEISLKLGLSDSALTILYTICDKGESCMLKEISLQSGVSKQTIHSAIRKLEAEGILYLEPAGAKNKKVCLTEKGKMFAEKTAGKVIAMENAVLASWTKEDVEKYLELTKRFLETMQEKAKSL